MIPKTIHLCWFSGEEYPVEIKLCLDSWKRVLPDYAVRLWTADDARAIGIPFINEALDAQRWAFAADAVRVYAVYTEGGVYADSDILFYKRFDEFLPSPDENDIFVTFNDDTKPKAGQQGQSDFGLNGAFFIGTKGNTFCRELLDYYSSRHYRLPDGTFDNTTSPKVMRAAARNHGWVMEDRYQDLGLLRVHPTHFLAPCKKYRASTDTFARHCVYGSWRKHKIGRIIERAFKHVGNVIKYKLSHL